MANNRYTFETTLEGFINVGEPGGTYNNCCFAYKLPDSILQKAENDREEILKWVYTKVENPKRLATNPPKWDDEGVCKYSYGGDTGRPNVVFVDSDGEVLDDAVRASIRKGTKVRLIVDHTPYWKPAMGTTLKVVGCQVIELVSGGVTDSGELKDSDIKAMFASFEAKGGFKQASPAPRKAAEVAETADAYDF
jgi:hypothetical protein